MTEEQKKNLVEAWGKSHKIIREIRDLAEQNTFLAYGVIRTAETIIDLIAVDDARRKAGMKIPETKEKE